jgi:hypothetical protein
LIITKVEIPKQSNYKDRYPSQSEETIGFRTSVIDMMNPLKNLSKKPGKPLVVNLQDEGAKEEIKGN